MNCYSLPPSSASRLTVRSLFSETVSRHTSRQITRRCIVTRNIRHFTQKFAKFHQSLAVFHHSAFLHPFLLLPPLRHSHIVIHLPLDPTVLGTVSMTVNCHLGLLRLEDGHQRLTYLGHFHRRHHLWLPRFLHLHRLIPVLSTVFRFSTIIVRKDVSFDPFVPFVYYSYVNYAFISINRYAPS